MPQENDARQPLDPKQAIVIGAIVMSRIGVNPGEAKAKQKPVMLCTVWGEAKTVVQRDSTTSDETFIGLAGSFYCETYQEKRLYRAPVAFLPAAVADLLLADLDAMPDNESLKFVVDIGAIMASNPAGYHYIGSIRTNSAGADPAFEVRALLPAARTLLIASD